MIDKVLSQLQAANDDEERQWIALEFSLQNQDAIVREAAFVSSIPHWFDAKFLSWLLRQSDFGISPEFQELIGLPFVEIFREHSYNIHERTRELYLNRLWKKDESRYKELSKRAYEYCSQYLETDDLWLAETVYHGLLADIAQAIDIFNNKCMEWNNQFEYNKLEMLIRPILKVSETGRLKGKTVARASYHQAQLHIVYSQYVKAQVVLETGLEQTEDDIGLRANCLEALGGVYVKLEKYGDAIAVYGEAISIFHKMGDLSREASCKNELEKANSLWLQSMNYSKTEGHIEFTEAFGIRSAPINKSPVTVLLEQEVLTSYVGYYEISLVIPTRNEAGNIEPLLMRIHQAVKGIATEVVFVDDSTDDTPEVIGKLQEWFPLPIKLIHRPKELRKNGLGGAVVEGFKAAQAKWMCVMDADLQHPPEMIPRLYRQAQKTGADVVMGSRLAPGGDASSLGFTRTVILEVFSWATRLFFPQRLWQVTDPLTGFFMTRRSALNPEDLRPDGFKILLEILVSHPQLKVAEVPIQFGHRNAGESKATLSETVKFFRGLFRLRLAGNENFVKFLMVGLSGLFVNSFVLWAFVEMTAMHYLVAAVIATQASTLWNFGLTEGWVFGKRQVERIFLQRLVSFLLMNNAMLLLRGPILTLLVSQLRVHYVIANLVSLFAMTVLRYLLADKWIWNENSKQTTPTTEEERKTEASSKTETFGYLYNIHSIIKVASMYELPELEYFRVPALTANPDIRVRLERRRKKDRRGIDHSNADSERRSSDTIYYSEALGRHGFEVTISNKTPIEVTVSPLLSHSRHVLYTNVVEPILRWSFVRKDYALVHAACVSFDGQAVLVTAQTDTGKTSTILRTVDNYACSFLSDDMTILSRDGKVLSYPKPVTISNHTLSAVNANSSLTWWERIVLQFQSRLYSKSGRKVALNITKSRLPTATMNAIVQMLLPPPKYMVHRIIPKATYANFATLSRAVIIERGPEFVESLQHKQAVETFVQNAEDAFSFPPYPILAKSLSEWNGQDLHLQEQGIVDEALKTILTIRLRDPKFNWWQRLPLISTSSPLGVLSPKYKTS